MDSPTRHLDPGFHPRTAPDRLAETIGRLMQNWMRRTREDARGSGLSVPPLVLHRALSRTDQLPVTRWADMVGASPSSATALLDGLEHGGIVRRTHATTDRRQVLVSLTPKGRRLINRLRVAGRRHWRGICRGIPAPELDAASATLTTLVGRLAEGDPPGDCGPTNPPRSGQ